MFLWGATVSAGTALGLDAQSLIVLRQNRAAVLREIQKLS